MKKEEAIKMLSNTKVYVDGKSKEIQEKLFSLGFSWCGCSIVKHTNVPFLYIDDDKYITYGDDMECFFKHDYKEISCDYILSIKTEEEYDFKPFDKVLVRSADNCIWQGTFISHIAKNDTYGWRIYTMTGSWGQIIPFEGNEHLAGTNDSPDKD